MAEDSTRKECSFFLVRYVPDVVRDEGLNIGLFLHSPDQDFIDCLFIDDFSRVKRFHPQADLGLLRDLQAHFEQQIKEHEQDLAGFVREMQESYSNLIQVTEPRACIASDPQAELQALFARYVGIRAGAPLEPDTRMRIRLALTSAFDRAGLLMTKALERRIPAEAWTEKGDPFTFDFGYRPLVVEGKPNGHLRLIHSLSLRRDTELAKGLVYTIGRVRRKEPANLTAVVYQLAGPDDQIARASQKILEESAIELQPLTGVDEFAMRVRRELRMG